MIHTGYAGAIRYAMRAAMGPDAYMKATALRPGTNPFSEDEPEELGTLTGYRYQKRSGRSGILLGLPGDLAGADMTEWFMDLSPGLPLHPSVGDLLRFENGDTRRIVFENGSGGFTSKDIYRIYQLEVI